MKKFLRRFSFRCFVLLFILFARKSSGQVWQWGTMHDVFGEGWTVTNDNNGNTFLGSFISSTAVIGSTTITGTGTKGLTTKYDLNGNLLWANYVAGGPVYGIDCDNNGNVYVTGTFNPTLTVGSQTLTSAGSNDIFLVKYDNSGNLVWVKSYGGTMNDVVSSISIDSQDNPVVTGYLFAGTANFGTLTVTTNTITFFVAKFDPSGNCQWVTTSPSGYSQGVSVNADLSGNVFVCGSHQGMVLGTTTLSTLGSADYFIAKLNGNGTPVWVSTGGTTASDGGAVVSVDPYGDVYLLGRFTGNTLTVAGQTMGVAGSALDIFLTKYSSSGVNLWAQAYTHPNVQQPYGLAAYNGGVYFTSSLGGVSYTLGTYNFTSTSATDGLLLANVGSNGNLLYATALSGGGDDVMALHMDNMCNLTLGGDLYENNVQIGNTVYTHTAAEALFVAKFNSGNTTPTLSITGPATLCPGGTVTLAVSGASTYTWSNGVIGNSIVVAPATNTSYAVIGISPAYTCQAKLSQNITVIQTNVILNATNTLICQGSSATLSVLGANTYTWNNNSQLQSIIVSPLTSSTYSVAGTGTTGCSYQAAKTISVIASPTINTSVTQFTVCKGNKVTLTASGVNTYTWNTGAHTNTISFTAQASVVYSVSGTNTLNACTDSKTIAVTVSPCTSLEKEAGDDLFSVYPNPSGGIVNFHLSGNPVQVCIYNLAGMLVYKYDPLPAEKDLSLSLPEKGVFLLQVQSSAGAQLWKKIIIE